MPDYRVRTTHTTRISISNILMGSIWGTALVLTLYMIGDAQLMGALAAVLVAAVAQTA